MFTFVAVSGILYTNVSSFKSKSPECATAAKEHRATQCSGQRQRLDFFTPILGNKIYAPLRLDKTLVSRQSNYLILQMKN
jgi:hypothetical protein